MTNEMYDILKYIAQIVLPAVGTLYFALASIWGLPYAEEILGTITAIDTFLGVDFTNSPANIDINRTPNGKNLLRDVPGKVRKSLGWEVVKTYVDEDGNPLKINGCHSFIGDDEYIIHAGTKIFHGDELIYDDANDARSHSWQFGDKLFIIDGKCLLQYYQVGDEENRSHVIKPVMVDGYIPIVTISISNSIF